MAISTAAAIIGSAVVGGAVSSKASSKAAKAQSNAAKTAAQNEMAMFERNVELSKPWRDAGVGALGQLTEGTSEGGDFSRDFTIADFNADPGYQFRMDQGRRGLEAGAAARGGLLSGGAGKDLVEYGQQFASGEYTNAYNRFNADRDRRFGRLSQLAGIGQTATRDVSNQGSQVAQNASNYMLQGANANAAGAVGRANAWNSTLGTIGNWYQQQGTNPAVPAAGGAVGSSGMNNYLYDGPGFAIPGGD